MYDASLGIIWPVLEQTCVIIMGCISPLRSVTKLKVPWLRAFASLLSNLTSKNKKRAKSPPKNGYSRSTAGAYIDLERNNSHELGHLGTRGDGEPLVDHIRKVDKFELSYDQRGDTGS